MKKKFLPLMILFFIMVFIGCAPRLPDAPGNPADNTQQTDMTERPAEEDGNGSIINNGDGGENGNAINDGNINENDDIAGVFQKEPFLKAAWIPTVYGLNYPSVSTANSQILKNDIDSIINKSVSLKLNALFFQVRPSADALYNSAVFPWSKYLTGTQGKAPSGGFDPLEYIIAQCHERGIALHAWINPFRVTALASDSLMKGHPALRFPETTFSVGNKIYFDPGVPQARQLIIDGVREIVENYDVDGIHYDDYFYPEGEIPDGDTFVAYGAGFGNINDWRRNNIDLLISETFRLVKAVKPAAAFGVSPPGIWANYASNALGSQTSGFQSYYSIFADSRGWVKKGYVDYIAPQIYWYTGQTGSDYLTLLRWWHDVCKDTGVTLYAGLAGYKSGDTAQHAQWNNGEELEKQAAYSLGYTGGVIFYAFKDLDKAEAARALEFLSRAVKT